MYYYLLEPIKSRKDRIFQEQCKRFLANYGIVGEMVSPNPARTIDELVDISLAKGYVTIVGVGSDKFIGNVLTSLLQKISGIEHRIVFGCVPIEYKASNMSSLINASSLNHACETLRSRHVRLQPVGVISPKKYFVTPVSIDNTEPFQLLATFPDFLAYATATSMTLFPDLRLHWRNTKEGLSPLKRWSMNLLGMNPPPTIESRFKSSKLAIETNPLQTVVLEGEIIAKTPIQVQCVPDLLHLIISRDKMNPIEPSSS